MAKVYVGCSLTHAPAEFVAEVTDFKRSLRRKGHVVSEFLGLVAGTPQDVYERDIHQCVAECEVMIAICDYPSLGLGWEAGAAVEKFRKPTLAVAQRENGISRLPIGAEGERNPLYRFRRYNQLSDVVGLLSEFLREIQATI